MTKREGKKEKEGDFFHGLFVSPQKKGWVL